MKKITSRQANFSERVYAIVAKIPIGKVMTYKQVATKAGSPHAARAVGNLMKNNYNPKIPCGPSNTLAHRQTAKLTVDVRFGLEADIEAPSPDVRFTPESGHQLSALTT